MTTNADDLRTPRDCALYCRRELMASVAPVFNPEHSSGEYIEIEKTTGLVKERKVVAASSEDIDQKYKKAPISEEEIDELFDKNPTLNYCIYLGKVSNNMIVVETDGPDSAERLESRILQNLESEVRTAFINTMQVTSGGGGKHYYFQLNDPIIQTLSSKKLWSNGKRGEEIQLFANGHYVLGFGCRHPNGNTYTWNERHPIPIKITEVEEIIKLLSAEPDYVLSNYLGCAKAKLVKQQQEHQTGLTFSSSSMSTVSPSIVTSGANDDVGGGTGSGGDDDSTAGHRRLTPEMMDKLLSWLGPYYIDGQRNDIIFHLSGMMRKDGGFSLEDTKTFITLLSHMSREPNEDLEHSLQVVENTYQQPLTEINGKTGLHELLVISVGFVSKEDYLARAEAWSRICQIMNHYDNDGYYHHKEQGQGEEDDEDGSNNGDDAKVRKLVQQRQDEQDQAKIVNYLVNKIMKTLTLRVFYEDTGEIIYYDKTEKRFRFGGERMIDAQIESIFPNGITQHTKNEVKKHIQDKIQLHIKRADIDKDPDVINLENCLFNTETKQPIPQYGEQGEEKPYLTMSKMPIEYDPRARCPGIEKFLSEVIVDPHELRELLKFIAYILKRDCRYEKMLLLIGSGSNGKSVLINILEFFVDEENCSHVSLHEAEEDRFSRARLFGKILNTYADNKSMKPLKETGNLKILISGDSTEAQEKFKPRFAFRNRAKFIISTNKPPETEDKSYAFYRRIIPKTFDRTFDAAEAGEPNAPNAKDTKLFRKLATKQEMSGLFNLAIKYLDLLEREGFEEKSMERIKREYEYKADHVARYLRDCCYVDPSNKQYLTRTETLQEHYRKWCREMLPDSAPLDDNVFGSKLVDHSIRHGRRRVVKGEKAVPVYEGVLLKHIAAQGQESIENALQNSPLPPTEIRIEDGNENNEHDNNDGAELITCPYCEYGDGDESEDRDSNQEQQTSTTPYTSYNLRDVQFHIVFRHPSEDLDIENNDDNTTSEVKQID